MKRAIKMITVKEWFEKRGDKVFLIWELPTKERIERLTSYNDIPYVEVQIDFKKGLVRTKSSPEPKQI